jgi:hypothetical protein
MRLWKYHTKNLKKMSMLVSDRAFFAEKVNAVQDVCCLFMAMLSFGTFPVNITSLFSSLQSLTCRSRFERSPSNGFAAE